MSYILRSAGDVYIVDGPRNGRGCTVTENRAAAKRFDSRESAIEWIDSIRAAQRESGLRKYQIASGSPVRI